MKITCKCHRSGYIFKFDPYSSRQEQLNSETDRIWCMDKRQAYLVKKGEKFNLKNNSKFTNSVVTDGIRIVDQNLFLLVNRFGHNSKWHNFDADICLHFYTIMKIHNTHFVFFVKNILLSKYKLCTHDGYTFFFIRTSQINFELLLTKLHRTC